MTVAAALMAIVLTAAYLCLNAGVAAQRLIDPRLEAVQSARVALGLLTADLRAACPLSKEIEFVGTKRTLGDVEAASLDFGTHNYTPARPGEGDFCQTSYFVDMDPESGGLVLWRRRNPRIGLEPLAGGSREEIARGIRQLKAEFYDGFEWYDAWGDPDGRDRKQTSNRTSFNLSGMPEAVRITLAIAPGGRSRRPAGDSGSEATASSPTAKEEEPLVFQTVARINVPKPGTDSAGGESDGGATAPSAPGAAPMMFPGGGG